MENSILYFFCSKKKDFLKYSRILRKQLIFYNWIYYLFYCTFSNKYQPIVFNQFKYFQLMFFKSIQFFNIN